MEKVPRVRNDRQGTVLNLILRQRCIGRSDAAIPSADHDQRLGTDTREINLRLDRRLPHPVKVLAKGASLVGAQLSKPVAHPGTNRRRQGRSETGGQQFATAPGLAIQNGSSPRIDQ